jgi:pimeloyl-ACP methyl ester carboxylesterase
MKWGIDFDQVAESMKYTIDLVDGGKERKKVLVGHDWGAFNSYNFDHKYPGYLTEMMTLDVGLGLDSSLLGRFFILTYQLFLILAFLLWRPIGDLMTKIFIKIISSRKYTPANKDTINASYNYFYYYLWRRIFLSLLGRKPRILDNYKKSCPLVYLYASDKPMMFHSQKFLLNLSKEVGNEMYAVKGGHWIMNKNEGLIVDILKRRIEKLEQKN